VALSTRETGRAHDRGEKGHRRVARSAVSKRVAIQTNLSRPLGHPASDVNDFIEVGLKSEIEVVRDQNFAIHPSQNLTNSRCSGSGHYPENTNDGSASEFSSCFTVKVNVRFGIRTSV
jgi:hypothetical protein